MKKENFGNVVLSTGAACSQHMVSVHHKWHIHGHSWGIHLEDRRRVNFQIN